MVYKKTFKVTEIETKNVEKSDSETTTRKLTLVGDIKLTITGIPEVLPEFEVDDTVEIIVKPTSQTKLSVDEVEEIEMKIVKDLDGELDGKIKVSVEPAKGRAAKSGEEEK